MGHSHRGKKSKKKAHHNNKDVSMFKEASARSIQTRSSTVSTSSTLTTATTSKTDFGSETWISLLGLIDLYECFVTIDQTSLWQSHIAWANKGKDIREYHTKRFASNMVFLSLLLGSTMMALCNSAHFASEIRLALKGEHYNSLNYWIGCVLITGAGTMVLGLISTYTCWGMISAISDTNAHAILRSRMGQYATRLPSRFVVAALYLFIAWILLLVTDLVAGPTRWIMMGLMLGVFFQIIVSLSAFGRLIIHTGAMGKKRVLDPELERQLLPSGLHASLLIKATEQRRRMGRQTNAQSQYNSNDTGRRSSVRTPRRGSTTSRRSDSLLVNHSIGHLRIPDPVHTTSTGPIERRSSTLSVKDPNQNNTLSLCTNVNNNNEVSGGGGVNAPPVSFPETAHVAVNDRSAGELVHPNEDSLEACGMLSGGVDGSTVADNNNNDTPPDPPPSHSLNHEMDGQCAWRDKDIITQDGPGDTNLPPQPLPSENNDGAMSSMEEIDDFALQIRFPRPSILNRAGESHTALQQFVNMNLLEDEEVSEFLQDAESGALGMENTTAVTPAAATTTGDDVVHGNPEQGLTALSINTDDKDNTTNVKDEEKKEDDDSLAELNTAPVASISDKDKANDDEEEDDDDEDEEDAQEGRNTQMRNSIKLMMGPNVNVDKLQQEWVNEDSVRDVYNVGPPVAVWDDDEEESLTHSLRQHRESFRRSTVLDRLKSFRLLPSRRRRVREQNLHNFSNNRQHRSASLEEWRFREPSASLQYIAERESGSSDSSTSGDDDDEEGDVESPRPSTRSSSTLSLSRPLVTHERYLQQEENSRASDRTPLLDQRK